MWLISMSRKVGSPGGFAGPWAWEAPTAGLRRTSFRIGGIGDSLMRYTVIEIGAGREGGDPVRHPHHVEHTGRLPINGFLAAVAAGDIHVGLDSGPIHVAAAAGKPSVEIYGGYIHPDCVSYPGNINLCTAPPCSPCWLLLESCPYDRMCLSRISPQRVEEAIASLARVGPTKTDHAAEQLKEHLT